MDRPPPRTLLERLVQESDGTAEEVCQGFEAYAGQIWAYRQPCRSASSAAGWPVKWTCSAEFPACGTRTMGAWFPDVARSTAGSGCPRRRRTAGSF